MLEQHRGGVCRYDTKSISLALGPSGQNDFHQLAKYMFGSSIRKKKLICLNKKKQMKCSIPTVLIRVEAACAITVMLEGIDGGYVPTSDT